MRISQMNPRIKHNVRRTLALHTIQHVGTIIFVLCSALYLTNSGLTALILAECAHIIYRFFKWFVFYGSNFRNKIKSFVRSVLPGAVAVIIAAIVGIYVKDSTIIDYAIKIGVLILVLPIVVPITSDDKLDDKSILQLRELSSKQASLYKLLAILYRILTIAGFILIIFVKARTGFYFESAVITGCIFWCCRVGLFIYFWWNGEYNNDDDGNEINQEQENYSDDPNESYTDNDGIPTTYGSETRSIAQKVARRWSYIDETFFGVQDAKLRYDVSCDVTITNIITIRYIVNGKLSGQNASRVYSSAQQKLYQASLKIKDEITRD
ncbi:MAG: hypothetical protein K2F73_02275, partial [Ruminococcus sp.]|nr:hypothetical protein [Ruminococcus sp.]